MRKLYFPLLLILLVSCGTQVNYLGTTYPSTKNVDVFVDQASVKKPFDVIGKGYIKRNIGPEISLETIQRKAVEKAKINGANAVVIEDYYLVDKTSSITKQIDSSWNLTHTANINPAVTSGFSILFIRYKE